MSRKALNPGLGSGKVDRNSVYPSTTDEQQALIDGLNHDLAGEYQAIVMYTHYSAKLTGPYRRELRALFQAEIPDEQATRSSWQTRSPTWGASRRPSRARFFKPTNRGKCSNKRSAAEKQAISDYEERIRQAEALGESRPQGEPREQVADETRHKEEIERILVGWLEG